MTKKNGYESVTHVFLLGEQPSYNSGYNGGGGYGGGEYGGEYGGYNGGGSTTVINEDGGWFGRDKQTIIQTGKQN